MFQADSLRLTHVLPHSAYIIVIYFYVFSLVFQNCSQQLTQDRNYTFVFKGLLLLGGFSFYSILNMSIYLKDTCIKEKKHLHSRGVRLIVWSFRKYRFKLDASIHHSGCCRLKKKIQNNLDIVPLLHNIRPLRLIRSSLSGGTGLCAGEFGALRGRPSVFTKNGAVVTFMRVNLHSF